GFSRLTSARSVTTEQGLKKHSEPWEWEATKESAGLGREFPKSPRLEVEAGRARGRHLRSPSPSPWMVFLMRSSIVDLPSHPQTWESIHEESNMTVAHQEFQPLLRRDQGFWDNSCEPTKLLPAGPGW
ncbi:hypothetical protein IHE44_0008741, partial [Lamprotornis superbus]